MKEKKRVSFHFVFLLYDLCVCCQNLLPPFHHINCQVYGGISIAFMRRRMTCLTGSTNLNSFYFSPSLSKCLLEKWGLVLINCACSRDASIPKGFVPVNHLHFHLYNFIQLRCYCKKSAAISILSCQIKSTSTHSIKIWQIPFKHWKKWRSLSYFFLLHSKYNIMNAFNIINKKNV